MLMQPIWMSQLVNHLQAISSSMRLSTWKAEHCLRRRQRPGPLQRQAIPPQQTAVLMAVTPQHSRASKSHPISLQAAKAAGKLWTHWQLQTSFCRQCQGGVLRMPCATNLQPSTQARLSKECQLHQQSICLSQRREWTQAITAGPTSLTVSAYLPDQMRQRGSIREATICQCLPNLAGLSSALVPAGCRQLPTQQVGAGSHVAQQHPHLLESRATIQHRPSGSQLAPRGSLRQQHQQSASPSEARPRSHHPQDRTPADQRQ